MDKHCISARMRNTTNPSSTSGASGGWFSGSSGTGRASKVSRQPFFLETPCSKQFSANSALESSATWSNKAFNLGLFREASPVGEILGKTSSASLLACANAAATFALSEAILSASAFAASAFSAACFASSATLRASSAACCFRKSICSTIAPLEATFSAASLSSAHWVDSTRSSKASISRSFLRKLRIRFSVAVSGRSFSTYSGRLSGSTSSLDFFCFDPDVGGVALTFFVTAGVAVVCFFALFSMCLGSATPHLTMS
mmetsp:Transcript_106007/g.167386  ORF Transcript_106007/g.167386 Transcript_106007/m.167386 type:complete len:258 (+) Transcript_106007:317-1090(+)